MQTKNPYFVYILKCSDNTFYTWITTDLQRRVFEHNNLEVWAKYTKARRPCELIYFEELIDRSSACKREIEIKKMKKIKKLQLIEK